MPWSGSAGSKIFSRATGFFTGATAWQQSQAGGRAMLSLDFDTHDQDLSDGISSGLQKNGDNTLTGLIPAGGYGFTGLGVLASAADPAIASAATTDLLGSAALINSITGTVTITSLGTGTLRFKIARFTGILTLTHNAASLILPGGANIVTQAGDTMAVISDGTSNARVIWYQRANKAQYPRGVSALSDGATPALDASLGDVFTLTAAGNRTIAVPTNPMSGQKIIIKHKASGADRTLALNTGAGGFRFGTDITALTATTSAKTDYIGCVYDLAATFWDVVAVRKGY